MPRAAEALLAAALAAQGVGVDDIAVVLPTHMHSDHGGGLVQRGFPKAQIVPSAAEAAHWRGKEHPAGRILAENAQRIVAMKDGDSLLPGLRLWLLPGHAPGHTGYAIDGTLAVVGDLVHRANVRLPDPRVSTLHDVDRAQAADTRIAALERIARDGPVACGGHMHLDPEENAGEGAAARPFLRLASALSGWAAVTA